MNVVDRAPQSLVVISQALAAGIVMLGPLLLAPEWFAEIALAWAVAIFALPHLVERAQERGMIEPPTGVEDGRVGGEVVQVLAPDDLDDYVVPADLHGIEESERVVTVRHGDPGAFRAWLSGAPFLGSLARVATTTLVVDVDDYPGAALHEGALLDAAVEQITVTEEVDAYRVAQEDTP